MSKHPFGNDAALRRQIVSSSPELRLLESQIRACAHVQYNNAAVAEREARKMESQEKDKQYAKLLEEFGNQERMSDAITNAERYSKKLETQRILQEQIAEKATVRAQLKAERTVEMMSEVDEDKVLKKEKEEKLKEQLLHQKNTRDFLLKQTRIKELERQEKELQDNNLEREAEEYNMKVDLLKNIDKQQLELERLHLNQRELSLVKQLEKGQEKQAAINNMRLEIEVLEKQAQEKQYANDKRMKEASAKLKLKEGWDSQMRYKQNEKIKEEKKEAEYRKMLLEVLYEEARLDQLVSEARKRRQLDHRYLVDQLLDERRAMRAAVMKQREEEDQMAVQYEQLRRDILEEEEKQLLLKHAPQLMPYFTPKLLSKLK